MLFQFKPQTEEEWDRENLKIQTVRHLQCTVRRFPCSVVLVSLKLPQSIIGRKVHSLLSRAGRLSEGLTSRVPHRSQTETVTRRGLEDEPNLGDNAEDLWKR